jgi:DNA-binding MarR family transcriptional regulator
MENHPNSPNDEVFCCGLPEAYQLIEGLAKRLRQFQEQTLKETNLTLPQYYILTLLAEKDGRPLKELAERLSCTRAAMTGIVDTMEKKELVTRSPNHADRRSLLITLTERGKTILQATPGLEKMFAGCCCEVLPADEGGELNRLLKKLSDGVPF